MSKNNDEEGFKLSELPEISNLDNEDLLLVSDYEGGKCYTRKLTIEKLLEKIVNDSALSSAASDEDTVLGQAINGMIQKYVKDQVASQVSTQIANDPVLQQTVVNAVSANSDFILDLLDGKKDNQLVLGGGEGA